MKMGKTLAILMGSILAISLTAAVSFAQTDRLVIEDAGKPVGIFTERDYLRKIALEGRSSRETPVDDVMSELKPTIEELWPELIGAAPEA